MAFYEKILEDDFLNPDYIVDPPAEFNLFPEDERDDWDPNCVSIFGKERNAGWLKSTWETYLRPKYRKALTKWNKDTGGGDGTSPSFINFCDSDRWLVYVFCKDQKENFLLAHSATSVMPSHLQLEAGVSNENEISPLSSVHSGSKRGRVRGQNAEAAEALLEDHKRQSKQIDIALEGITTILRQRGEKQPALHPHTPQPKRSRSELLDRVANLSEKLKDEGGLMDTMTPTTKEKYKSSIVKERKEALDQL